MGLPGRERSLTISSSPWIQYKNVTDGRMDTHQAVNSKDRVYAQRRAVKKSAQI